MSGNHFCIFQFNNCSALFILQREVGLTHNFYDVWCYLSRCWTCWELKHRTAGKSRSQKKNLTDAPTCYISIFHSLVHIMSLLWSEWRYNCTPNLELRTFLLTILLLLCTYISVLLLRNLYTVQVGWSFMLTVFHTHLYDFAKNHLTWTWIAQKRAIFTQLSIELGLPRASALLKSKAASIAGKALCIWDLNSGPKMDRLGEKFNPSHLWNIKAHRNIRCPYKAAKTPTMDIVNALKCKKHLRNHRNRP
jgi:hypothetical protein